MRVKELKEELDHLGVEWRGVMFDKETLQVALEKARDSPPAPPQPVDIAGTAENTEATTEASGTDESTIADEKEAEADEAAYAAAYESAYSEAIKLKVKEIRGELAARSTNWGDLFEKEELAARLAALKARAALFSRSGVLVPGEATVVDGAALRTEMADDRTPLLIDVYATWCGPCKMIAPMLSKVAAALGERARVVKLDSDAENALSSELRVQGLPTLIFMRDGREAHRLEGVPPGQGALEALVREHLGVEL